MLYMIDLGQWNSVFAVPSSVVDKYIKIATEAQLKVLLYILRHSGEEISEETLSSALRIDATEAQNALSFWTEHGLLAQRDTGVLKPADTAVSTAEALSAPAEKPGKPRTAVSRAQRPEPAFVAKLLKEDTNLAGLLEEAQTVLNKPLSPGDTATLVMLYDSFGLPCDVIALMINHLASDGGANMRTIERTGIRWADDGIRTAEDAEREIERMAGSREAWGRVSSLLGIRNVGHPTKSQLEHADRWVNTWGFNDEMIAEAYERCVNTKGEYNIRYINAILQKWYDKRIFSLDALHEHEAAAKRKSKSGSASKKGSVFSADDASFDISKYENRSLFDD